MVYRTVAVLVVLTLAFMGSPAAFADAADEADEDGARLWMSHAEPFDFRFENRIDSHQQSEIVATEKLIGFLYVHRTGELTDEGIPIAHRAKCSEGDCSVGWQLKGVPISAQLVNKGPLVWLVNAEDLPDQKGYTHFQWVGTPKSPSGLLVGQEYPGYLMRRNAPEPFFWIPGNQNPGGGSDGDHTDGGCDDGDHTDGGCDDGDHTDHTDGGCAGGGDDHSGGQAGPGGNSPSTHAGRLVPEGIDDHSNIVTEWDGTGHGGGGDHDDGGCSGDHDDGGCSDDHDDGGCSDDHDDGGCSGDDHATTAAGYAQGQLYLPIMLGW